MKRRFIGRSKEKGISPLIAAVLLIAFTMTVAAILATWAQSFGEERLTEAGEEGVGAIDCPQLSGNFVLEDGNYDYDTEGDTNTLVFGFDNVGTFDIEEFRFRLDSDDEIMEPVDIDDDSGEVNPNNITLGPNEFQRVEVDISDDVIEEIEGEGLDLTDIDTVDVRAMYTLCGDEQPLEICEFDHDEEVIEC